MTKQLGNENTCIICETKSNPSTIWKETYLGNFRFCCHYYGATGGPCCDALQASIKLNKAYVGQENYNILSIEEGVIKVINDAREIYEQQKKLVERTLLQPRNKFEKITQEEKCHKDPYKEHRENLEKNPGYRQYLLDEHKCELCGNKGSTTSRMNYVDLFLNEKQQQLFIHFRCYDIISKFAIATGASLSESFDKLKPLFEKKQQPTSDKKKECRVLGSLDLIGNPWNR